MRNGAKDTAARAAEVARTRLEAYAPPPLDDAIRQELEAYVVRRRAELGD
jgi:trimethylamine--corrinoid protein Co-methyltransferase